eukprot:TRINITY_DN54919_c0_g1_i1.p1 TRINITY_DN54919_c0_g1~~TRINITY_DN54919_c0_g1_i1.p1  ORF type:complete len:676 (-),score=124.66 TRINITY_DN54919_c0_g1_i1:50-2017(-)
MAVNVRVCTSSSCTANGAQCVVRDIEDLCQGKASVEEWGCMGKCEIGPNVEISKGASVSTVTKLKSFTAIADVVTKNLGVVLPPVAKKVGQMKYDIRRESEASKVLTRLAAALSTIGGEVASEKSHPLLLAQLLLLRSKVYLTPSVGSAILDAEKATTLMPGSAFAFATYATALAAGFRHEDAVIAQKKAIEIGTGIDPGTSKRNLKRYERRAGEESADPEGTAKQREAAAAKLAAPMETAGEAVATAAAPAAATAKTPKAKGTGKALAKRTTIEKLPSPIDERLPSRGIFISGRPPSDSCQWQVIAVSKLNYNNFRLMLVTKEKAFTSAHTFPVKDVWHVDILKETDDLMRAYTPVSDAADYTRGFLDFMIKVYPDGRMTSWLVTLKVGDTIQISEPCPTADPSMLSTGVFMVAGGSAVTVAIQLIKAVFERHENARAYLLLCNSNYVDIIFADKLAAMQERYPNFSVTHCISAGKLPENLVTGRSKYKIGRVCVEDLEGVDPEILGCVSGPMGLCQAALNVWTKSGRKAESFTVLDPLPPASVGGPPVAASCRSCLGLGKTLLDAYCICPKGSRLETESQSAAAVSEAEAAMERARLISLQRAASEVEAQQRMEERRVLASQELGDGPKIKKQLSSLSPSWIGSLFTMCLPED